MTTRIHTSDVDRRHQTSSKGLVLAGCAIVGLTLQMCWSMIQVHKLSGQTPFSTSDVAPAELVLVGSAALLLVAYALFWAGSNLGRIAILPLAVLAALANSNVEVSTVIDGANVSSQTGAGRIFGVICGVLAIIGALQRSSRDHCAGHKNRSRPAHDTNRLMA